MLLYHYSASQSIEGTWPTTDDIAREIEADEAEIIGTAKVIEKLKDAGLM